MHLCLSNGDFNGKSAPVEITQICSSIYKCFITTIPLLEMRFCAHARGLVFAFVYPLASPRELRETSLLYGPLFFEQSSGLISCMTGSFARAKQQLCPPLPGYRRPLLLRTRGVPNSQSTYDGDAVCANSQIRPKIITSAF
jgi:hypothetical protein